MAVDRWTESRASIRILPSVHSSVMCSVPNEFWTVRYFDKLLGVVEVWRGVGYVLVEGDGLHEGGAVHDDDGAHQLGALDGDAGGEVAAAGVADDVGGRDVERGEEVHRVLDGGAYHVALVRIRGVAVALAGLVDGEDVERLGERVKVQEPVLGAGAAAELPAVDEQHGLALSRLEVAGVDAVNVDELGVFVADHGGVASCMHVPFAGNRGRAVNPERRVSAASWWLSYRKCRFRAAGWMAAGL